MFPSRREGLSAALIEAMASGLPCVVSDIRGNRELIGSRQKLCMGSFDRRLIHSSDSSCANCDSVCGGILFPPMQTERLAEALEVFMENPQLRHDAGCYNRKRVRKYDVTKVSRRMEWIYEYMGNITGKEKAGP